LLQVVETLCNLNGELKGMLTKPLNR